MKPTFTIEMCNETLDACSNGADFKRIAERIGVSPQAISVWSQRGKLPDEDGQFVGHPRYQLFAVAVEIGRLIYDLKCFKRRMLANSIHQTPKAIKELNGKLKDLSASGLTRTQQLEWFFNENKTMSDHIAITGRTEERIDEDIKAFHKYYNSLVLQVIKFEDTWENPSMGRPRLDKGESSDSV